MITPELLALLRCPQTRQVLSMASAAQLAQVEARRAAGDLRDHAGRAVRDSVSAGLVRADGALLYPISNGIPVLLLDAALPLGAE
ncbi:MAG TPA: hypothetical protein VK961_05265 [Chthoniobacter sp.]|nr:hypothetical protein [Chthoniobacter sp.]